MYMSLFACYTVESESGIHLLIFNPSVHFMPNSVAGLCSSMHILDRLSGVIFSLHQPKQPCFCTVGASGEKPRTHKEHAQSVPLCPPGVSPRDLLPLRWQCYSSSAVLHMFIWMLLSWMRVEGISSQDNNQTRIQVQLSDCQRCWWCIGGFAASQTLWIRE